MPLFTKDDLTKSKKGKVFLIGEKHDESNLRREAEKLLCLNKYKVSVNTYFAENELRISTSPEGVIKYADDFNLRTRVGIIANMTIGALLAQLPDFYFKENNDINHYRDQLVSAYKNTFAVLSSAADPLKSAQMFLDYKELKDLKVSSELDGDNLKDFADLKIETPKLYDGIMKDKSKEMAEIIKCLDQKKSHYKGKPIGIALVQNLHAIDCSIAGYSYPVTEVKAEDKKINAQREQIMLEAAGKMSDVGRNLVWKIGDNHARNLKELIDKNPELGDKVTIITRDAFNKDLVNYQQQKQGAKSKVDKEGVLRDSLVNKVTDNRKMEGMKFKI